MDTEENELEAAGAGDDDAAEAGQYDIGIVLGQLDDGLRAQVEEQLEAAGKRLTELTATLTERSGRDSWKTEGAHVEVFESGQSMIRGLVEDPEAGIEFNVELRPSNFFDEARPWRPGQPPMQMDASAWDVEGEVLVMKVAKVSGRKYTIQESAAELEEQQHDTPEAAVGAFAKYVEDMAELALSRDPVATAWQSDVTEYGTPPDAQPPHEFV
jgi:hypothetical protein